MKKIAITFILVAFVSAGIFQSTFREPKRLESILEAQSYTMPAVDLFPHVVDLVPY
jgi:hypothetical protein